MYYICYLYMYIKRLFYSDFGRILLSILLGFGLATLFRKVCNSRNCIVFKSPPLDELRTNTYQHNNKCYKFEENSIKCDKNKKKVKMY